jgi:hypothetical protein
MNEFQRLMVPEMKNCPTLDRKSICAMFNIVGQCYFGSSCHHSHEDLPNDVCEEIGKWIEECKEVAKESPKKNNNNNSLINSVTTIAKEALMSSGMTWAMTMSPI